MTDRDRSSDPKYDSLEREDPIEIGRFQLLDCIGHGGMGRVFEAWDPQLERRVAIKVLLAEGDESLALREARFLARVADPNVVMVHEVGSCPCPRLAPDRGAIVYIAMEYVDGPDLRRWLAMGPRRWTDVLDAVLAAGRGLAAVHRAGLIHGDVKPQNVLVGQEGRVRVADFGLARVRARAVAPELAASVRRAAAAELEALDEAAGEPKLASLGPALAAEPSADSGPLGVRPAGTLPYMAPECLSGERTPRDQADQYSLCAMAWEALFGTRPFGGRSASSILTAIALDQLEPGRRPRGMPRAVVRVLQRGLSERPEARWASVEALLAALERARRPPRWVKLLGLAGAGGAVIVVVLGSARGVVPASAESGARTHPAGRVEQTSSSRLSALGRASAALARARVSERSLAGVEAELGAVLAQLDREGLAAPALRVELLLARARIRAATARLDLASEDVDAALDRAVAHAHALPSGLVAQARVLGAIVDLRRGRCVEAGGRLAAVRVSSLDAEAERALMHARQALASSLDPRVARSAACTRVQQELEALAEAARLRAYEPEFTTPSPRRSK